MYLFLTEPFIPFIVSIVFFPLCLSCFSLSDFVISLFVVPPSLSPCPCLWHRWLLAAAGFPSPLPPPSWHVVGSVGRATLILRTHFSPKTGKSACVRVSLSIKMCPLELFFLTVLDPTGPVLAVVKVLHVHLPDCLRVLIE